MKLLKITILVIVLITVELVLGATMYQGAVSMAQEGIKNGYVEEIRRVALRFDEALASGKTALPDYTGNVTEDNVLVIDGKNYVAAFNVGKSLRTNSVSIYSLSEICDNSSADNFIISDDKVYAVYSTEVAGGADLAFTDLSKITEGFTVFGFDGLVVFSNSGRAAFIKKQAAAEIAAETEIKAALDYPSELDVGETSVKTVEIGGVTCALAITGFENADYFVGGYADYTATYGKISSFRRKFVFASVFTCAVAVAFVLVGSYFSGGNVFGSGKTYRFKTDAEGKILNSDENFKSDFPEANVVKEKINRFQENEIYAINLPSYGEEKTLACVVDKSSGGVIDVTARELCVPFGSEFDTEEKDAMKTVYDSLVKSPQVLVGKVYFENLQEIKNIFGRDFAEDVLKVLSDRVKRVFAYTFRFDDYNLGIIQPDGKMLAYFLKDASKILAEIGKVIKVGENNVIVKIKYGFALSDNTMSTRNYEYVASAADAALKRATDLKEENRANSNFYIFREAQKKAYSRYMFVIDIPKMLKDGDFYIEYQPQYSFRENRIVGFEALFRVNKRVKINIDTLDVINYAEHSGDMVLLGNFIISEGLKFAKSVENFGVTVSLNVSPVQFMQTGFVDNFLRIYGRYDLKPNVAAIEITESYLMQDIDETIKKLRILREHGIMIHLDDFGTQYSSFGYLKALPISALKIDKSFVQDIDKNQYSEFITKMIVDIARRLNHESICEGVETAEQLKHVLDQGCDIVQGYLIARPTDENTAREMITSGYVYEETKPENGNGDKV